MPLKVGPYLVSMHRTEAEKKRNPGEKERFEQKAIADGCLDYLPRRTKKPFIQFQRVTPFTRFPTISKVNSEIGGLKGTSSRQELVNDVRQHFADHRKRTGRDPSVVVLGDHHGEPSALALVLTVVHDLGHIRGRKKFMFESHPDAVRLVLGSDEDSGRSAEVSNALREDRPLAFAFADAQGDDAALADFAVQAQYAKNQGFTVEGFDMKPDAANWEERQAAMHQRLDRRGSGQELLVVVAGSDHVAELYEKYSPNGNTLAIATMGPSKKGDTIGKTRGSFLLATDSIMKFRPAGDELTATRFDPVRFINHELSDRGLEVRDEGPSQ